MKLSEFEVHVLLSALDKIEDELMENGDDERGDVIEALFEKLLDYQNANFPNGNMKRFFESKE
jgi:hypothetical protein